MNLPEGVGAAFPPMEAFISSEHFKDSRSKECAVRNPEQCQGVRGRQGFVHEGDIRECLETCLVVTAG